MSAIVTSSATSAAGAASAASASSAAGASAASSASSAGAAASLLEVAALTEAMATLVVVALLSLLVGREWFNTASIKHRHDEPEGERLARLTASLRALGAPVMALLLVFSFNVVLRIQALA